MESDDLGKLYDLSDPLLLHIIAFQMSDYVPEAREVLQAAMQERGLIDADIRKYREIHLRRNSLSINCDNCGIELQLEREDLEAGMFSCPECKAEQIVNYPGDAYYCAPELDVTVMPEEVAEVEEEAVLDDVQEDEQSIANIEPEPDPDIPAGSSGVTCLLCQKELGKAEVFVSDGEFYCEQCYSTLLSSLPPDDSTADESQ